MNKCEYCKKTIEDPRKGKLFCNAKCKSSNWATVNRLKKKKEKTAEDLLLLKSLYQKPDEERELLIKLLTR